MQRPLLLVLAVFAVAVAAGCGSDEVSKDDYQASVVAARNTVNGALAEVVESQSKEELIDRMKQAGVKIDRAADRLDEAGVAKGFEDETDALVTALRQLSVDISATGEQIAQPGFENLLEGTSGFNFQSWTAANRALESMREQGIDVEPIARQAFGQ